MDSFDVVIVGGGPAGLSAALILGRCRRRVLVCDQGSPRNAAARALHGFLSRDGIEPAKLLEIAREQLRPYKNVEVRFVEVVDAVTAANHFVLTLGDGAAVSASKLLLATGVVDELPQVEGLQELYGMSVFHCPYCDGWEMRDRQLAVYGRGESGAGLALKLTLWSKDIILCTDGPSELTAKERERLHHHGIKIREDKIARLEGSDGKLTHIVFQNDDVISREGLFFSTGQSQRSDLAARLGCDFTEEGCVKTGDYEITNVKGVYVAGDASRLVQLVVVAAAEGAQAAFAINQELLNEDLR